VQLDPVKPNLKPPGTKRLKLEYDGLLSSSAFKSNLRRYNEEAMLAVGALAYATGEGFEKYAQALYPFIELGLKNHEEYEAGAYTRPLFGST